MPFLKVLNQTPSLLPLSKAQAFKIDTPVPICQQ